MPHSSRRHARRKHRDRRTKLLIQGLYSALAILVLLLAVFFVVRRVERSIGVVEPEAYAAVPPAEEQPAGDTVREEGAYSPQDDDAAPVMSVYRDGQLYTLKNGLKTVLIMGIDDMEVLDTERVRNSSQADFLLLAILDPGTSTCTMLQINRDTMTDVPVLSAFGDYMGIEYEQIALAHTYGNGREVSAENTVTAVSRFLYGVPIDNYIALTMGAVPVLNDTAGGVTVTVEDDFTGVDDTLVRGETVTLMGEHALLFVRSRYAMAEDSTNLRRMERQQQYIAALLDQLRERARSSDTFLAELYLKLSDHMIADCGLEELLEYAAAFSDYAFAGIVTPQGEIGRGDRFVEFYPDDAALRELVIDLFFEPAQS